jgi:biopolymer transport protein ExbD
VFLLSKTLDGVALTGRIQFEAASKDWIRPMPGRDVAIALVAFSVGVAVSSLAFGIVLFLVVTAQPERTVQVVLPEPDVAQPLTASPAEVFVNIDEKGRYFVGGEQMGLDELRSLFGQAALNNPGRLSVVIRAHRQAEVSQALAVMNACNELGIYAYSLTIDESGRGGNLDVAEQEGTEDITQSPAVDDPATGNGSQAPVPGPRG